MSPPNTPDRPSSRTTPPPKRRMNLFARLTLGAFGILAGFAVIGVLLLGFMLAMAYPNLPALDSLTDYRPKMPLRIFSADNVLIGEFGEERRNVVRFKEIPDVMKKAVLAIEDDRFYEHGGVDYFGILRAAVHNAHRAARARARRPSRSRWRATSSCRASRRSSARSTKCCWPGRSRRT